MGVKASENLDIINETSISGTRIVLQKNESAFRRRHSGRKSQKLLFANNIVRSNRGFGKLLVNFCARCALP